METRYRVTFTFPDGTTTRQIIRISELRFVIERTLRNVPGTTFTKELFGETRT